MTAPAPIPAARLTPRSSEALQRRSRWISRRARNVSRHPLAVGTVTGIVFLALLVVLVVIPVGARRAARAVRPRPGERPDTTALAASVARASAHLAAAAAALDSGRAASLRASEPPPAPVDTLPPELVARRDSLARLSGQLLSLLRRASDAPLAESYRALGEAPAMRSDAHVRALLDSLAQVERTREAFGAAGGVDPVFVALTARATNIGQQIQRLAQERYAAMHHEVLALTPPPPP
ncbi:MAG TPA: hypothetical protein VFS05_02950, partial [Gemmatimonadaceae bacterium]|nr:hypothetical protein [Gemmatimonadaceae bacterium]